MRITSHIHRLAVVAACLLGAVDARADLVRADAEFSVSTDETEQGNPTFAHLADGRVVVAWAKAAGGCCGESPHVGRIFNADGSPSGPEFPLGSRVNSWRAIPIRTLPSGDRFVVVRDAGDPDTPRWQIYDSTGAPVGAEVTVDSGPTDAMTAFVAVDGNGDIAILYLVEPTPYVNELHLQRYTTAGIAVGPTVIVTPSSSSAYAWPLGLETGSDGSLLVAWVRYDVVSLPGDDDRLPSGWIRRYGTNGAQIGSDFSFAASSEDGYIQAVLRTDGLGHMFVAHLVSSAEPHNALRRYMLDGTGAVDYLAAESTGVMNVLAMSATPDGRLAAVWAGTYDYDAPYAFLTQFAGDATQSGPSLPVSDDTALRRSISGVSTNDAGSVFVGFSREQPTVSNWLGAEAQRFCDTGDSGCARCTGIADNTDADDDEIPDACDPCTNIGGTQDGVASGASVSTASPLYERKVKFDQSFVLPAGTEFSELPVMSDGVRLRIETSLGQAMFEVTAPGGSYAGKGTRGWTQRDGKFLYTDKTDAPVNGLKRLMVVDRSRQEPGLVRVKARAGGGEYGTDESRLPMRTIAVLGGAGSAEAGVCGEFSFAADDCAGGNQYVGYSLEWSRCTGR